MKFFSASLIKKLSDLECSSKSIFFIISFDVEKIFFKSLLNTLNLKLLIQNQQR